MHQGSEVCKSRSLENPLNAAGAASSSAVQLPNHEPDDENSEGDSDDSSQPDNDIAHMDVDPPALSTPPSAPVPLFPQVSSIVIPASMLHDAGPMVTQTSGGPSSPIENAFARMRMLFTPGPGAQETEADPLWNIDPILRHQTHPMVTPAVISPFINNTFTGFMPNAPAAPESLPVVIPPQDLAVPTNGHPIRFDSEDALTAAAQELSHPMHVPQLDDVHSSIVCSASQLASQLASLDHANTTDSEGAQGQLATFLPYRLLTPQFFLGSTHAASLDHVGAPNLESDAVMPLAPVAVPTDFPTAPAAGSSSDADIDYTIPQALSNSTNVTFHDSHPASNDKSAKHLGQPVHLPAALIPWNATEDDINKMTTAQKRALTRAKNNASKPRPRWEYVVVDDNAEQENVPDASTDIGRTLRARGNK